MNKINNTIFQSGNFHLIVSVRLTDKDKKGFNNHFKLDNGYVVLTYSPRKAFIIKDFSRKDDAEVIFPIDYIYDLRDILTTIYRALQKTEMFYVDELNSLVPNIKEIEKNTFVLGNNYNSIKIRPDYKKINFEEVEGVSFIFKNKESLFLDHKQCKKLIKLLHATDFLTYTETIITNGILTNLMGGRKNEN